MQATAENRIEFSRFSLPDIDTDISLMALYVRQSPRNTVKANTKKIHRNGSNYSRKKGNEPNKPTFCICEHGHVTSMKNENSCVPEHGGCSTSIGKDALTNPARITGEGSEDTGIFQLQHAFLLSKHPPSFSEI